MIPAPIPPDEAGRLRALHELLILDTPPEERFDRIVRFAAEQLDAPIAALSLVDGERQWFKSRVGLDIVQLPRDRSLCAYAILQPDVFVVEDIRHDPRFAMQPRPDGDDGDLRFYAGAPVCAPGGQRIGTLCILDHRPRRLSAVEMATLEALRGLVDEALAGQDEGESTA